MAFNLVRVDETSRAIREYVDVKGARQGIYQALTLLPGVGYTLVRYTGDTLSMNHPEKGKICLTIQKK